MPCTAACRTLSVLRHARNSVQDGEKRTGSSQPGIMAHLEERLAFCTCNPQHLMDAARLGAGTKKPTDELSTRGQAKTIKAASTGSLLGKWCCLLLLQSNIPVAAEQGLYHDGIANKTEIALPPVVEVHRSRIGNYTMSMLSLKAQTRVEHSAC